MSPGLGVLVVDDSAFVRRAVERMLGDIDGVRVVGTAANGARAVEQARELRPDLILLDVSMPEMDGLEALERIMKDAPTAVILLSTLAQEDADVTLRALELGAVDFIDKTSAGRTMDIYGLGPLLAEKVRAIAQAGPAATERRASVTPRAPDEVARRRIAAPTTHVCDYDVVAVAASTGGPRALTRLLPELPARFGAAVVVAQHMPAGFTGPLAERLDARCALAVSEARDGDELRPGRVIVAPGGRHTRVARDGTRLVLRVTEHGGDNLYRPSADLLFRSVADVLGRRGVAVVLTGMGDDGAAGLRALRDAGGRTIVESEETAVIFGMPRAAAPAAEKVARLDDIATILIGLCGSGAHGGTD